MDENQKKYQCDICDHKFSHKDDFKEHVLIVHGSMKRFKCELCPKDFTLKSSLRAHLASFHEQRKQNCNFCDKLMSNKENLKRHI